MTIEKENGFSCMIDFENKKKRRKAHKKKGIKTQNWYRVPGNVFLASIFKLEPRK